MKTRMAILLLMLAFCANAQYHALISEDKVWKGITYGWGEFPFYQHISGDSLINDTAYWKVWSSNTLNGDPYNIGLIREDNTQQKVFVRNGDAEHVLYDFSAETGDVISCWGVSGEQSVTITSVESVVVDGELRKKLNFQDAWSAAFWIEGIGSVYSIMDAAIGMVTDYGPTLNCFYEETQLVWSNENSTEVCVLTLDLHEEEVAKFQIWPNPTSGEITIFSSDLNKGKYDVFVFSSLGAMIQSERMSMNGTKRMDLSSLSAGLYTVSLFLDHAPVASVRVLKE